MRRHAFAQFGADDRWTLFGPDGEHIVPLPPPRLRINHAVALRQAAVAGYGIILQSRVTLAHDLASGRLIPVLTDHAPEPRPLTLVRRPDRRMTAGLRAFVEMAVSAFGDEG
ncbi:LysR substrate-binding domain-containing protein [Sphingomonas sp. S-NIH.Pt15_0812]|uniref:LysR substrate-binding domain-containing protein n=1 Tax=Sphingomonas sp. S-NIH.Pt15_0812 TaxID=1920129 RepID=UPI001F4953AE|nr:LysR substrate-binding domain-containing protein [Sphingomonas sp. S-NIH.Pt15_0812]